MVLSECCAAEPYPTRRTPCYQCGERVLSRILHRSRTIRRVASMPSRRSWIALVNCLCICACCGLRSLSLSSASMFSISAFSAI